MPRDKSAKNVYFGIQFYIGILVDVLRILVGVLGILVDILGILGGILVVLFGVLGVFGIRIVYLIHFVLYRYDVVSDIYHRKNVRICVFIL